MSSNQRYKYYHAEDDLHNNDSKSPHKLQMERFQRALSQDEARKIKKQLRKQQRRHANRSSDSEMQIQKMRENSNYSLASRSPGGGKKKHHIYVNEKHTSDRRHKRSDNSRRSREIPRAILVPETKKSRTISPADYSEGSSLRQPSTFIQNTSGSLGPPYARARGHPVMMHAQQTQPSMVPPNQNDSLNLHVNNTGYFPGSMYHSRGVQNRSSGVNSPVNPMRGQGPLIHHFQDNSRLLSSIDHIEADQSNIVQTDFHLTTQGGWIGQTMKQGQFQNPHNQGGFINNGPQQYRRSSNNSMSAEKMIRERASEYSHNAREALNDTEEIEQDYKNLTKEFKANRHLKGRSSSYSLEQYSNQANRVLNVHDTSQSAVKQTLDKASKINLSPMAYDSIKKQQQISDYKTQVVQEQPDIIYRNNNQHNREVSFNMIRGTQVTTSNHGESMDVQPLEAHRQLNATDEKGVNHQPRYSRRSLISHSQGKYPDQKSSSKSIEMQGCRMHKTMSDEHYQEFNQQQRRHFSKTIESPLQQVSDTASRVRSSSPPRYQVHQNVSDKHTKSEKVLASSPRFSQAERRREVERITEAQRVVPNISLPLTRQPIPIERRLEDLEDEPPIPMELPEQCQEMSMLQNMSSAGLTNMNFNTQDLIQMTCPKSNSDYPQNDVNTSEARDHQNVIKNRQSGRTTSNTRGLHVSSNPNFRSTVSNTQTGNALIPNGLGSDLYSSALMHTQDARCQNDDTFRGENFIQQQSLDAGIGSMGSQVKGSANAFQATKQIIMDGPNSLTGTRGIQQSMKSPTNQNSRVADKFDLLVEKYWIKQKLGSIHQRVNSLQVNIQNIASGINGQSRQNRADSYFNLIDYKRMSHIDILNDLDKLTKRLLSETSTISQQQHNQGISRGLSKLSDIDSHYQMSRLSPRNNRTLALQANASTSSIHTKYDLDLDNLRKQKEEGDAMVNNLRKTIKDMAKQMKELEKTPSISRTKIDNDSFDETQSNVHFLESKLEKKAMNERDLKDEIVSNQSRLQEITSTHEAKTRQLKDQFKNKFDEQNSFIDDLKSELNSAITRTREQHTDLVNHGTQLKIINESLRSKEEENTRLSRQIETLNRTLQISKQQQVGDQRAHEGDKLRLNAAKEQEKHWKCGYETIFKKYSKLKEQIPQKDQDLRKMEREYQQKIKNISRKAEDAIRHFKNLAISRVGPSNVTEPRMSHAAREARFQQQTQSIQYTESQHTLTSNNQYRSRSVNTALANVEHGDFRYQNTPSSLTRAGQATPARDQSHNIHYSARRHADTYSVRSFSPRGPSITFNRGNRGELDQYRTLSNRGQKRLKFLDRIQNVNQNERGTHPDDKQLLLALEALEDAFNEIACFKTECHELSKVYFSKTCQQLQNFQVQSYDYTEQIESYITRDKEQVRLLKDRQKQIGDLKLVVENSQQMIKSLVGHIKEIKGLKEMQWRNIISYDLVKDQEKRRLKESVHCEVQRTKNIIAKLHEEIRDRETIIDQKAVEVQQVEQDKYGIDNRLREVRDAKEEVVKKLNEVSLQKSQLEGKMNQIQQSIQEIHISTGADQTASATYQSEPISSGSPSMTQTFQFGSKAPHLMDDRNSMTINEHPYPDSMNQLSRTQVEPQKFPHEQKIGSYEVTLKQNYRQKSDRNTGGPMMPLEWLSQIKIHLGQLKDQIHQDSVYQQAVGDLVANHLNQKDDTLLHDDQESSADMGNPFQADNRENQSLFANKMGTELNISDFKVRTNSPSYERSYVASGPQTHVNSPSTMKGKKNLMRNDTASHSLDSFMNQENQGVNYQEERAGGMQRLSDIFHHKNYPIHDQIRELLRESRLKSLTILSMRKDFQVYQDEHDQIQEELRQKIQGLEHQIQSTQSEKDQLGQVYEQENKMRQDLEGEVEEKNQAIEEANDQIKEFESDLKQFQEQMNSMVVEKQKVDQSCEYWEGSFKLVEQHFLEQKERSHNEIDNLTQQVQMLDDTLEQRNQELQDTREELQLLKAEYIPIQEARKQRKDADCQTNETRDTIQRFFDDNEVLFMENEQIKRDIQVLIDSYENYKKENQKIQDNQREQLEQMQKECAADKSSFKIEQQGVIDHLNREIQDQIQVRQQKEALLSHTMQTLEEYEKKGQQSNGQFQQVVQNLEKDKEELEVNLISQQNQIDSLNNFNQVIQSFNEQLQFQMNQIKEQTQINFQNQQYQTQLMAQSSTSQVSPMTTQQNKLQHQASGLSPQGLNHSLATSCNNTNRALEARFRALPSCSSNTLQKSQSINHFAQRVNEKTDQGSTSRNQMNVAPYDQPHFHSMSSVRQFVRNRSSSKGQEKHAKRDSQFSFVAKNGSQDKKMPNQHDATIQNLQQQLDENEEFILALSQGGQQMVQRQQNQNIDIQVQGHVIEDINHNNISINMNQQTQSPTYPDEKNETLGINSGVQSSNAFISNMTSNAQVTPTANAPQYVSLQQQQQQQFVPQQIERQLNTMSGSQVHLNQLSEQCYVDMGTQQNGFNSHHAYYNNQLGANSSRGQINSMNPTSNRLDPRSIHMEETSMGLDMCQQCIEYQGQAQTQKDLVRKLVQNYVQHARKLTSMCMEGSILLRLNGVQNTESQKILCQEASVNQSTLSVTGKGRNVESSLSSEVGTTQNRNNQGNLSFVSALSDPEKKTNLIRQAQKFLQKDIEKFIGPREIQGANSQNESNMNNKQNASIARKQDRLVRYANEMVDIAQLLVQNSCEITINNFQGQSARRGDLGKSSSLKIHDYQPQTYEQDVQTKKQRKRTTTNIGCQTVHSEPTQGQTVPSARNPKSPSNDAGPLSDPNGYNAITPCPQQAIPNHIHVEIEDLGTSLDNKISIFVQLLLGLKTTQKQINKEDLVVHKMLKQLTSAISRMVHELTEDTETLAEIKQRLSDFQPTPYLGGSFQKQDSREEFDHPSEQSKASKAADMPLSVTMDCIRSMSKTQNIKQAKKQMINNPSTVMGINFVNDDGRTQSQDFQDQPTAQGYSGTGASQPHSKRSHNKISKKTSAAKIGTNQQINSATYIREYQDEQIISNPYQNNVVDPFYHQTVGAEDIKNTFGTMNNVSYHLTSNNENNQYVDSALIANPSEDTLHEHDTESVEAQIKGQSNPNWNVNETRDVVHMVNDISNMFKQPSVQQQAHEQVDQRQGQVIIDSEFHQFGQQMLRKKSLSPRTYLNQHPPSQSKDNTHRSGHSNHNMNNNHIMLQPESSHNTALGYNQSITQSKPDLERTTRTQLSQPERLSNHQEMNMTGRQVERKISREDMRALDQKLQQNRDILQVIQEQQQLQSQINNLSSAKGSMHRMSSQTLSINHLNKNRDNMVVQQQQEPDMYKQQYYQAFKHDLPTSPNNDNYHKSFNQIYDVPQNPTVQYDKSSPLDYQIREQAINNYGPSSSQTYRQNHQQRIMYDQEKHVYQTIETDGVITYKGSSMTNNTKRLRNDQ